MRSCSAESGLAAAAAIVLFLRPAAIMRSDRLRVATTDGTSEVTVGESALTVAPRSLVLVSGDDDRGIDVVLDRGTVTCEVAPRKGRPPFVVEAGGVRVRVIGTKFTVARDDQATSVAVEHGVVEVTASGTVIVIHDGERWPRPAAAESIDAPASAPATVPVDPGASPSTATARPIPGAVPVSRSRGAPVQGSSPSTDHPSSAQDVRPAPAAAPPAASPSAPATPAAAPPATDAPRAAFSTQEAFESAARIERTRPDDAATIYRQVAATSSAWAPSALFALARLEVDRGHRADAVRLLDDYLARYPRGINAADARALVQRMR